MLGTNKEEENKGSKIVEMEEERREYIERINIELDEEDWEMGNIKRKGAREKKKVGKNRKLKI